MKGYNILFIALVVLVTSLTYFAGIAVTGAVTGMAAAAPANTTKGFGEYMLRPSFRQPVGFNFIKNYEDIEKKANETRDSMIACLEAGSYRNDDNDDLETCAKANHNKGIIKSVRDMKGEYYIMFDMGQGSARFAIHLQDNIPPPATENMRVAEDSGKAYLLWDRSKASDVAYYDIYYIAKGAAYISLSDLTKFRSDHPVEKADITLLDYNNLDFLVVAKDEAGNIGFKKVI